MVPNWLLCLAVVAYVIYKFLTWNYNYWYKRGVPCLPGKPPFGNIADIFFHRKIIGQLYKEIYNKFDGSPWCGFFKMRTPILMVRDPELIKTILIKEFNNFNENDFHFNFDVDPIFAMNPFSVTGQRWRDMRAILAPTQTPAKIKTVVPCTTQVAKNMVEYINENLGNKIEMLEFFGHFATDVTASWGLGLKTNSFRNPQSDFRTKTTNMFGGDFKTNSAILLGFYAPSLNNILRWSTMREQFSSYFTKVVVDVLNNRQTINEKKNDYVDMLLEIARDSITKNKRVVDFQEITGHALTFFTEGYLTSSFTLTFIFHELSKNQDIQEKARQEIHSVIGSLNEIDYDKIQKLNYTNQIIEETLRLHPTVPMMTKVCLKKTVLHSDGKELTVEPGTPIAIPIMGIHHDPKYYKDPLAFDPDRFSEEEKATRDKILNLGFSDGPRACVGFRFALTNLKICLAALLLNFKILPSDPRDTFTIDKSCSFIMMPKNAYIKFARL